MNYCLESANCTTTKPLNLYFKIRLKDFRVDFMNFIFLFSIFKFQISLLG
ncbi:hypothetical protein HPMG_00201 [Helicobacter pullorum MIT 98-5489]|uniref:Uncharacterized protein n=1 Tax=Helicobacter pullorum MIT 98-5489 TaxID=537972 RepID=C5EXX4_9HELI|nr:hypothetical protein HPMG_00201 [Helicobacter pullorum MIT 98-5489]